MRIRPPFIHLRRASRFADSPLSTHTPPSTPRWETVRKVSSNPNRVSLPHLLPTDICDARWRFRKEGYKFRPKSSLRPGPPLRIFKMTFGRFEPTPSSKRARNFNQLTKGKMHPPNEPIATAFGPFFIFGPSLVSIGARSFKF